MSKKSNIITEEEADKKIIDSEYSVKNVKFMKGHDAPAMSCTLYKGNKRIATVFDDSWGGGFQYTYLRKNTNDEKDFEKFSKSFIVKSQYSDKLVYNEDCIIDALVNNYEEIKQYKKWCKDKIVFQIKGDDKGVFRTLKGKYTEGGKNYIQKKYEKDLIEILNERFI